MRNKQIILDDLFVYILDNSNVILGVHPDLFDPIFASYEQSFLIKKDYTEISISTKSGLISIYVSQNLISDECILFPNTLEVSKLISKKCDELFLKISNFYWINHEGNIRIKQHTVYGMFSFFNFERVNL